MKVMVVGSGGREHTLVWKIKQSPLVSEVLCVPGNAGIAEEARCVTDVDEDTASLADLAQEEGVDLTVVGPEAPLVEGIVDEFEEKDLAIFGPRAQAARIEGSKGFAKDLMREQDIPTGDYRRFDEPEPAKNYIRQQGAPIVVKADGLAAGKGSIVCHELEEALEAVETIMVERKFGDAGDQVVVEEMLEGEELSILALTDGTTVIPLASSQDHKPAYEGDKGPNTGGMGAYSPAPAATEAVLDQVMEEVLVPAVEGLKQKGCSYKGVLYAGLMITEDGPKVLEFNARFGDPEAQVIIPKMENDLVEVMMAVVREELDEVNLHWSDQQAVCVVMASGGYPIDYETGKEITGLDAAKERDDVVVFHAGTARKDGRLVTAGGRVLGITAWDPSLQKALDVAYEMVDEIDFEDCHYRTDIAYRALERL